MPLCTGCLLERPAEDFYAASDRPSGRKSRCKGCMLAQQRRRYATDPEARQRLAEQSKRWKAEHPDRRRVYEAQWARDRRAQNREACLDHYGRICTCCREMELAFLVIDHIDGGGNEHRRQLRRQHGLWDICTWLVRQGFPDGFQTLCHNCNFAKSHGGCPHQVR